MDSRKVGRWRRWLAWTLPLSAFGVVTTVAQPVFGFGTNDQVVVATSEQESTDSEKLPCPDQPSDAHIQWADDW